MSAPFDPSDFSVKAAIPKLSGLDNGQLKALYDAELAGKHRTSLMSAISSALDSNLEAEEAAPKAPAAPSAPDEVVHIDHTAFMRLNRLARRKWQAVGGGKYKLVG